jgi:hypothetical protein
VPFFSRYIGIDYSGAKTANSPLPGIRVYAATAAKNPVEIRMPGRMPMNWTRAGLAQWLADVLLDHPATIVGIDHAFSFPLPYFKKHRLKKAWPEFLADFEAHWPTHRDNMYVDFIRDGLYGNGAERTGSSRWRRICDVRSGGKSVFHFDIPGSVAKATFAGLPWLRFLREKLEGELLCWPFDGWVPKADQSVIAEVYPAMWKGAYSRQGRDEHQQDAYAVARWLRDADREDRLLAALQPALRAEERAVAEIEGWILGLGGAEDRVPTEKATPSIASKKAEKKVSELVPAKGAKQTAKAGKGKSAAKEASSASAKKKPMSAVRKEIHRIADDFHGKLVTQGQLFLLQAFLGSLDDTLYEDEVLSLLQGMPPDFSMPPREELRLIEIDLQFKITAHPAPPYPHDPEEWCRKNPRR